MTTFDFEYRITGLFTSFLPNTPAGEDAWREMASKGHEAILSIHTGAVLAQLRAAGYSVRKALKPAKVTASEIDNLLAELGA